MPRCSAGNKDDALGLEEYLAVVRNTWDCDCLAIGRDTAADAVGKGLWLLKNLLEHKVRVATLLKLLDRHLQLGDCDVALAVGCAVVNLQLCSAVDNGNIAIVEVDNLVCILDNRCCVRSEEVLAIAHANNKWRRLTRSDNLVWILSIYSGKGVCAHNLLCSLTHRLEQRAVVGVHNVLDKLYGHLCICLADKCIAV